jgi:hypothetical protein
MNRGPLINRAAMARLILFVLPLGVDAGAAETAAAERSTCSDPDPSPRPRRREGEGSCSRGARSKG